MNVINGLIGIFLIGFGGEDTVMNYHCKEASGGGLVANFLGI